MFRGANEVTIDAKGRMAMPARYREEFMALGCGSEIVVTVDIKKDNYLVLYPKPMWEKYEAQLLDMPYDEGILWVRRRVLGNAMETTMDGQGRILISPLLRKEASLGKKARLIGQGKRFELWDEATWVERNENFELSAEVMAKLADQLKI